MFSMLTRFFLFALSLTVLSQNTFASPMTHFQTLGVSAKGQYVAIEEIHIDKNDQVRVRMTVLNTWKEQPVHKRIEMVSSQNNPEKIRSMREEALAKLKPIIEKHHINLIN
jgi:hypothetical protein